MKTKQKRSEKLSARITKELMLALEEYAENQDITVSRAAEKLIEQGLKSGEQND